MKHTKRSITSPLIALVSSLVLSALLSTTTAAKAEGQYYLYGNPPTGTRLAPKVVTSPLPLEATYEELTAEDKAKIRANYDGMPEADEPPFPKAGLKPIWETIYENYHPSNQKGDLVVIASVDLYGVVREVAVYETTSNHMTKLVSTALAATEFKPAKCGGEACAMDFIFEGRLDIDIMRFQ